MRRFPTPQLFRLQQPEPESTALIIPAVDVISRRSIRTAVASAAFFLSGCGLIIRDPAVPPYPKGLPPSLSRQDAIADLAALVTSLENVHPDIYFKHSRE